MKNILLPLRDAARLLGVKSESLQSEADAGRVPFTKLGDEYLFAPAALERALAVRAGLGETELSRTVRETVHTILDAWSRLDRMLVPEDEDYRHIDAGLSRNAE